MMRITLSVIFVSITLSLFGQSNNYERLKKLYDQGKFQETIDSGKKEISKLNITDPFYEKTLGLIADCHINISDFKSAIDDYKSLITIDSNKVAYLLGISYAYWSIEEIQVSLNYLLKAYNVDPKDAGTLNNMTYFFGQAGKYDESIEYATQALEQKDLQNTLRGALLNNRGYSYIGLKQYDKALKDINESIIYHPNNSFAYCNRAVANISLKRIETVCKDLEKSKSLGTIYLAIELIEKYCK